MKDKLTPDFDNPYWSFYSHTAISIWVALDEATLAHAAGANMTPRPRRAMTCAYMPDGSTFNGQRNILPEDYYQTLAIGDPLQNDAINPLIWKAP